MTKYQWPDKAIVALAKNFTHLEVHAYRKREYGEQALLTYQARVRRNWHDVLKQNTAFNIALFNDNLLQSIYKGVVDKAQVQPLNEVSFSFSSMFLPGAHACLFSFPLFVVLFLCYRAFPLCYR
jgi:hypothetical protein